MYSCDIVVIVEYPCIDLYNTFIMHLKAMLFTVLYIVSIFMFPIVFWFRLLIEGPRETVTSVLIHCPVLS